jgi:hypothetical protein
MRMFRVRYGCSDSARETLNCVIEVSIDPAAGQAGSGEHSNCKSAIVQGTMIERAWVPAITERFGRCVGEKQGTCASDALALDFENDHWVSQSTYAEYPV